MEMEWVKGTVIKKINAVIIFDFRTGNTKCCGNRRRNRSERSWRKDITMYRGP
jgi:hypothetical protein